MRDAFPEQLADVTAEEFWRSVNAVRPNFIRVEADELTYDLHIILRTEIEAALMAGEIAVKDLPGVWNEKMKAYLGLDVPNDTLGVLQDVHWSHGYVGSFPTYTIGNIMSAQFFETAIRTPAVAAGLDGGRLCAAQDLARRQHPPLRPRPPRRTRRCRRVTGGPLDASAYIRILSDKVAALVG